MFPACSTEGGQCAAFPDVCKTPSPAGPVPIPYPNMAMCSDGKGAKKVKFRNKDALRKGDSIRMSTGDEAGSAGGGIISNKIKGKGEFQLGWMGLKAEGKMVAHLTVMVMQNSGSAPQAPGANVAPGQTKIKVMMIMGMPQQVRVKVKKYKPETEEVQPKKNTQDAAQAVGQASDTQSKISASEELGDAGARNAAQQMAQQHGGLGGAPAGLGNPHSFSGRGTFDVVAWCKDGTVLIMEAKGGGSSLGTAMVNGVGRCQQGTPEYMRHIAENMAQSSDPARRKAGKSLKKAIAEGKAKYSEARTKYDKDTFDAKPTVVKEFDPPPGRVDRVRRTTLEREETNEGGFPCAAPAIPST